MQRGVINVVEVLILLIIFLAAAAFFASFYLSSVTQQSQKVQQETQQTAFLVNPPVKVIGTIVIENYTSSDTKAAGAKDAVPFACVEETSGSRSWWLASVYELKGYQGSVFKSLSLSDAVEAVDAAVAANAGDNLTSVTFGPLNKVIAICYINGKPSKVYNLTVACDVDVLNKTVINATNWCESAAGTEPWKVKFVNVFQYLPAGGVGVVVGPIVPYEVVEKGASFSFKITFARTYEPNPTKFYQLRLEGLKPNITDILEWLRSNSNRVSAVDTFEAVCEGCTFSVG